MRRRGGVLLCFMLVAGGLNLLPAQNQPDPAGDPFGGPGVAAPAADPFGGPNVAPPPRAAAPAAKNAAPEETDRFVLELRAENPATPLEWMSAVQRMLAHGRPDEAHRYLQRLVAAELDDELRAALHRKFGSAVLLEVLREPALQPEGQAFALATLEAAERVARNPVRVEGLVRQLSDPAAPVRYAALVDLRDAQEAALAPLLRALLDPSRSGEHAAVREALWELAPYMTDALVAAIDADPPQIRQVVIEVLGAHRVSAATPRLMKPAYAADAPPAIQAAARAALEQIVGEPPFPYAARQYLLRRTKALLAGETPDAPGADGLIGIWYWDAQQLTSVVRRFSPDQAAIEAARRLAGDLLALAPGEAEYQQLYLLTLLESEKRRGGPDQPLGDIEALFPSGAVSPETLEEVLQFALKIEHPLAATAAAEVLGRMGGSSLLQADGGRTSVLVEALRNPSRRVRSVAAAAIMAIDPREPYAGSSFLTDTLGYHAAVGNRPRALVAYPRVETAQNLVGLLDLAGYEADVATRGRQVLQMIGQRSDYQFIFLSDAIDGPPVNELVQYLRADPRAALLPIGIMTRQEMQTRMQALADSQNFMLAFPRPSEAEGVAFQAARLIDLLGAQVVPHPVRLQQAAQALEHLGNLAAQPQRYDFYDLARHQPQIELALFTPGLTISAAKVLGELGTPAAQRTLVNLASLNHLPLADRQAASAALAVAVRRHGLLLTRDEILRQYDRYNQSRNLDRETQLVLGGLLDILESRQAQAAPQSPAPSPSGAPPAGASSAVPDFSPSGAALPGRPPLLPSRSSV